MSALCLADALQTFFSLSLKCILSDCTRDTPFYNTGHWLDKKDYVYVCRRKLTCVTIATKCVEERKSVREGGK